MSEELDENTAIFIGCIIGLMILCIFGIIIWFCWYKKSLRQQQTPDDNAYKKINTDAHDAGISDSDNEQNGHTTTTTDNTNGENIQQTEMVSMSPAAKNTVQNEYKQEEHEVIIPISEDDNDKKPLLQQLEEKDEEESHNVNVIPLDSDTDNIQDIETQQQPIDDDNNESSSSHSMSSEHNDNDSVDNSPINIIEKDHKQPYNIIPINIITGNIFGKTYDDTVTFNDENYFKENKLPLHRLHLCFIKYWQSDDMLLGIQCKWDLYNDNGNIIDTLDSQINYLHNDKTAEVCILDFGNYLFQPITIKMGKYINSISLMSETVQHFGGNGGNIEQNIEIPTENIIIGFHGGFGDNGIHNLSVISIPYKQSIGYDLIKHLFDEYKPELDSKVVGYILDYVFYLHDIETETETEIEQEEDIETWEQPRPEAMGTCIPMNNYTKTQTMEDAKIIRQALRGIDDHKLLEITGRRDNKQRIQIKEAYGILYEEKQPDLLSAMEKEFNGPTGQLFCACYMDIGEFDARMIYKAIAGQGVDKYELNEIICTRTNQQINGMKDAWEELEDNNMKEWINGRSMIDCIITQLDEDDIDNNDDDYKEFLIELLNGNRLKNKKIIISNIKEYAAMLFNDKRRRKRNQKQMCETLGMWSWSKIAALYDEFNKLPENNKLFTDIIDEMFESNQDVGDALCVIVEFCVNPYDYWSKKIKDSMSGTGTNNDMLIRCVVSRCEIDLYQVRQLFDQQYGDSATLQEWIQSETTGFYQKLLLLLCGYESDTKIDITPELKAQIINVIDNVPDIINENKDDNIDENIEINDNIDEKDIIDDDDDDDAGAGEELGLLGHAINAIEEEKEHDDIDEEEDVTEEDVLSEISDDDEEESEQEYEEEEKLDDIILYDDIEQEYIQTLLKMELPKKLESPYFLGERKSYKVPNKKSREREYTNLERDLRRLTVGLKGVNEEDRKYCKLVILRYYDILCETFKRYCFIGGDKNWLTPKGWKNLYKDLYVIDKSSDVCNEEKIKNLYEMTQHLHDNKKHEKNIDSEWNGIWQNDSDNQNENMFYKIKQMSETKIKGCINTFDFCDINGVLKNDSKKKTKKFIIFYHRKTDKNIPMKADANLVNEGSKIKIKYETIEESPHKRNNVKSGRFVLNKVDELSKDDNIALKAGYGLLRYEFFDVLLKLSQLKFEDAGTHNLKYQSFLKLIQDYVIPFIWDEINDVRTSKDGHKWLFKKDKKSLAKLFKMYSKKNIDLLCESEWNLLCKNLFNNAKIVSDAFKNKGKPSKQDIYQSFQLAKTHLYHLNLTYNEFEKALGYLAHKIYKKKPRSKYDKFDYQDKLKLLLKWAVKLQELGKTKK